ncbi:hypothetical protein UPYG_G00350790 [Umbra pygmaea]|uniref:Uncharacterized protein n=1 Tax=Umbra pygmaea TaxID=75934 RepID=A0ABD0VYG1_UMBPY
MSRRGSRRRNSRRRKSSTSSKQGVPSFDFPKQNKSNSVVDDITEKGEIESLCKENILSASDDEEVKYSEFPSKEKKKKVNRDIVGESSGNKRTPSITKKDDKDRQVKFTTLVTIDDLQPTSSKIVFQHCHFGSNLKFEIQETLQSDNLGIKTVYMFQSQQGATAYPSIHGGCEKTLSPNNDSIQQSWTLSPNVNITVHSPNRMQNYDFNIPECSKETGTNAKHGFATGECGAFACRKSCCDDQFTFCTSQGKNSIDIKSGRGSFSSNILSDFWKSTDALWDIPPPQEFSDCNYDTLEDLTEDIASCQIGSSGNMDQQQRLFCSSPSMRYQKDSGCSYSLDDDDAAHLESLFDRMSESDNYEPMFMRPSSTISRSSYTKEFIQNHEMKTHMSNNSIATVERTSCSSSSYIERPTKRRRTFPEVEDEPSRMQEGMPSWEGRESFSSDTISSYIMESRLHQAQRLSKLNTDNQESERLCLFNTVSRNSSQSSPRPSSSNVYGCIKTQCHLINPFCKSSTKESSEQVIPFPEPRRLPCEDLSNPNMAFGGKQIVDVAFRDTEVAVVESGFDEAMGDMEEELIQKNLRIQVIPPSRTCSEEQIFESSPTRNVSNRQEGNRGAEPKESTIYDLQSKRRRGSVITLQIGDTEQRFLQNDLKLSESAALSSPQWEAFNVISEIPSVSSTLHEEVMDSGSPAESTIEVRLTARRSFAVRGSISSPSLSQIEEDKEPQPEDKTIEDSDIAIAIASQSLQEFPNKKTESQRKPKLYQVDSTETQSVSKSSLDVESAPEHWIKRRNLFRDSKQWSSNEGTSINSSINEESGISEDSRSMDMAAKELGDKGFYTETFHSASWIYSGDEACPTAGPVPPGLHPRTGSQPRTTTIRERTVKIRKGLGEYPWGFRIQFSKPIVVTEVDTNGAAEEAGLLVGDFVIAVNGIDVTSIPHSEAADLARQGPDLLTLTIGSDIGRGPNSARPTCRGYLHKRTQTGLIKGWRRRWFVLRHDSCLYYYRHKKDEGRKRALSSIKLEGADIGGDPSLGKPFVFKCCPLSTDRVYHFCATSNLEMKRWLDAMERAVHPITQESRVGGRNATQCQPSPSGCEEPRVSWPAPPDRQE